MKRRQKAYLIAVYDNNKKIGYIHYNGGYIIGGSKINACVWKGKINAVDFIKKFNDYDLRLEELK